MAHTRLASLQMNPRWERQSGTIKLSPIHCAEVSIQTHTPPMYTYNNNNNNIASDFSVLNREDESTRCVTLVELEAAAARFDYPTPTYLLQFVVRRDAGMTTLDYSLMVVAFLFLFCVPSSCQPTTATTRTLTASEVFVFPYAKP